MKTLTATLLALVTLALIGCSRNPIVGTWEGSDPSMPVGASATFKFDGDGGFSTTTAVQGTSITMNGTYTLEEKALTLTPVSVDATGGAFADMVKEQFEKSGKQPIKATIEFKSNDEMTMSAGVGTSTLKRKG